MMHKDLSDIQVPEVSVVIPLYNKRDTIARALDSILAQTIYSYEVVVVVDDGSTDDGGEEIVRDYMRRDPRIRLITQKNKGVSSARNHGVHEAKSDLIAFLDADDEWMPNFLETILRLRKEYPEAGLYGTAYKYLYPSGNELSIQYNKRGGRYQIHPSYIRATNQSLNMMIISTSGMAIPKSVFVSLRGFPTGYLQNEDRFLRALIGLHYPFAYSPEICSLYHCNPVTYRARGKEFREDPFVNYVEENSASLMRREDWLDIQAFCDWGRVVMSRFNLLGGNSRFRVQKTLRAIQSKSFVLKAEKYYYLFLSHLPMPLIRLGSYLIVLRGVVGMRRTNS